VSVFMIMRVPGDPVGLEQYTNANAEMMQRIAAEAKTAGATRHAFAAGDGEVLVIDEWPNPEAFQRFFDSQKEIPKLMQEGGAKGSPEISFYRRLDTPDIF
jgi:hypothetical protein